MGNITGWFVPAYQARIHWDTLSFEVPPTAFLYTTVEAEDAIYRHRLPLGLHGDKYVAFGSSNVIGEMV